MTNLPNTAAEDTVFENLGLTREDLGMDTGSGSGNEDLDTGSGNEQAGADLGFDDGQEGQQQQPRVSQTEGRLPQGAEVKPDGKGNLVND